MLKVFLVCVALFVALLVFGVPLFYLFVAQPFKIVGVAMSPTLNEGDYILAQKYDLTLQRGDIVIHKNPQGSSQEFVKRIIGLPGDKISLISGKVYINDAPLK